MPNWLSLLPHPPAGQVAFCRETASNRYERASRAIVVPGRSSYCGLSENPFDVSPLNTDVASLVRQALALTLTRDVNRSDALASTSFVARANASLPPGACVTRSCSS